VLDVLRMAEEVSGRSVPHEIAPRRPGDPTTVFADPTLVRAVLGWRATHDLREIVSSAWRWHSK
jgi:UDP-glucose 4-epimerase